MSVLVYLLAFTLPYWLPTYYLDVKDEIYAFAAREPWRGALFYVALVVLFSCYLLAYRSVARTKNPRISAWSIGLWTLLFCLLLMPVKTITSTDIYGYVFQGRIPAVLGENPFAHLYKDFSSDPFFFCVTFRGLPATTGYGPLWVAIEAALGWLARNRLLLNLFLFKGLAAGLHLLSSILVYATLKRVAPQQRLIGMLFYAWNPVLLYELVGNAHNDAAVVLFALLGFYLLSLTVPLGTITRPGQSLQLNRAWWGLLAVPCFVAAALVKPVALLWMPPVAVWLLARRMDWSSRLRWAIAIAALVVLPAVLAYAPYWAGATTFRGLLVQSDIHGNTLPSLFVWALWSLWPHANDLIVQGVKLFTVLVYALFYTWQVWRVWRSGSSLPSSVTAKARPVWSGVVRVSFDVMLFYLLFVGFQFWPWYLAWLVTPAALLDEGAFSPRRVVTIMLCVSAPLLYFPFGWQWSRMNLPVWGMAFLAALPMLGLCVWLGIRAWRGMRVA